MLDQVWLRKLYDTPKFLWVFSSNQTPKFWFWSWFEVQKGFRIWPGHWKNMLSYLPQFKQRFINLMFQFQQSIFQIILKITRIVPIFKKGVKTNPISMLSIVSKITEKIMSKLIHVDSKILDVLSANQYGFRPGRSTAPKQSVCF